MREEEEEEQQQQQQQQQVLDPNLGFNLTFQTRDQGVKWFISCEYKRDLGLRIQTRSKVQNSLSWGEELT